jgi:hypothetical protein
MKQITIFVIFVLVTGMIMSVYDDVFALSDKGQEKGKATGCEKGTAKNNPHCNGSSSLPENTCDTNNDGITADELGFSTTFIIAIETTVSAANGDTNSNLKIDTLDEWNVFQIEKPGLCVLDS